MIELTVQFDIEKWRSYEPKIITPYFQDLLRQELSQHHISADKVVFRGGFGRQQDLARCVEKGTDYEASKAMKLRVEGATREGLYASEFDRLGKEPWVRGLDPLYWALKGHANGNEFNPVNALAVFWKDKLIRIPYSDIYAFKSVNPSIENVAALIHLKFEKNSNFS